jgi:signal transduction histidine kinase
MITGVGAKASLPQVMLTGPLYPLAVSFFSLSAGYGIFRMYQAYRHAVGINKKHLAYLFYSSFIGCLGGSTNFLRVFDTDLLAIMSIATYALPLYMIGMTYAVLKYRWLDITVIIEGGLVHVTLFIGTSVIAYPILLWGEHRYFGHIDHLFSLAVALMITIALLIGYQVKSFTQTTLGRWFFPERVRQFQMLTDFSSRLVTILELDTLTSSILKTLTQLLHADHATLYLYEAQTGGYVATQRYGVGSVAQSEPLPASHALPQALLLSPSVIVRDQLQEDHDHPLFSMTPLLATLQAAVCLPLLHQRRLLGFCLIGPHLGLPLATAEARQLLLSLANHAAIAIDNARLIEDLKQSHLVIRRTDQLRSLETMAGGFAHEIRNPLVSIKTFIQLLLRHNHIPSSLAALGQAVEEDLQRIERLVKEILDYARHKRPQCAPENLNDIVQSSLHFLHANAVMKHIQIEPQLATDLPPAWLDRQQIKQVLFNVCLNAFEAMDSTGGTLTFITTAVQREGKPWVQLTITDTGCGIAPDQLGHIFDPFFTTKHTSSTREGTGLGLAITAQIIREHGGSIEVTSTPGAGTSFVFHLPIHPANALNASTTESAESLCSTDPTIPARSAPVRAASLAGGEARSS